MCVIIQDWLECSESRKGFFETVRKTYFHANEKIAEESEKSRLTESATKPQIKKHNVKFEIVRRIEVSVNDIPNDILVYIDKKQSVTEAKMRNVFTHDRYKTVFGRIVL